MAEGIQVKNTMKTNTVAENNNSAACQCKKQPIHTLTFFKNNICRYQMPKRFHTFPGKKPKSPVTMSTTCSETSLCSDNFLEEFTLKMNESSDADRQNWLLNRFEAQIGKELEEIDELNNEDRDVIYATTAMEFFLKSSKLVLNYAFEKIQPPGRKKFAISPGTYWLTILQKKLLIDGDFLHYHNNLQKLIESWETSPMRLLMKDVTCPGLIQNCIDGRMNCNNIILLMMENIFGIIPEVPGPFKPVSLMYIFVMRIMYEAKHLEKFEKDNGLQDGIEDYFKSKYKTHLNYALKAFFKANAMINRELKAKSTKREKKSYNSGHHVESIDNAQLMNAYEHGQHKKNNNGGYDLKMSDSDLLLEPDLT